MSHRDEIVRIYQAAVERVQPAAVVAEAIRREGQRLFIRGSEFEADETGVSLIALGKAAVPMARAAEAALGDLFRAGIVVTKAADDGPPIGSEVLVGSHPVPEQRSIEAGQAILRFAADVPEGGLVLCLVSGGASALVESLVDGVAFEEFQALTQTLLRAGATIQELNAVRTRLSRIKGGGLLSALGRARVVNLIISDVLGDDPAVIASGPTVPPGPEQDAEGVLRHYGLDWRLPGRRTYSYPGPATFIVASLSLALDAAVDEAVRLGYQPVILSRSLQGEAREVGSVFATIVRDTALGETSFRKPVCLLAGGETTVTVRGEGVGGRNSEAALAGAISLRGTAGVSIGFLATDGDDGTTGAAGGIVDGATLSEATSGAARDALSNNDSFGFLQPLGATHAPGPTGTNVNDLMIGLVGDPALSMKESG
jgi:hydroxypyruvate reductase